jgi:hypothetical protein
MPMATLELQRAYMAEWYLRKIKPRREKWIKENGPCRCCGSWKNLEVDHKDPSQKVHHRVWSWSELRRQEELKKCQVLCHDCHLRKTVVDLQEMDINADKRRICPPGTAWCYRGKHFVEVRWFSSDAAKHDGLQDECRICRSKRRSPNGKLGRVEMLGISSWP